MKKLIPILFVSCTALAIAAGFFLPGFVFSAQDLKLQERIVTYQTDSPHFHPVSRLSDSLRLIAEKYTSIDLSSSGRTNAHSTRPAGGLSGGRLDANGAYQAELEALRYLKKQGAYGITAEEYPKHTERPFLAISEDKSTSAILWRCRLFNDSAGLFITMLIDDRSGKMLSLVVVSNENPLSPKGERSPQERANDFFVRLSNICSRYYGLPYKSIHLGAAQLDHNFSQLNGLPDCYYTVTGSVTLGDESGGTLALPMGTYCGTYVFNADYMSVG